MATKATKATKAAATKRIRAWEDDPLATGALPVERAAPKLPTGKLKVTLDVTAPSAKLYEPGTAEFRYWVAAEALARAVAFWTPLLPRGQGWQNGGALAVRLDAGDRLNAFYNRIGLSFFHARIGDTVVYTGESPDVIAHELGHAVLDAIRPQLWDAMSTEVAAFHEAFGDISAILTALQQPTVRDQVIAETEGLYRASRVTRVAEQLGWGARHRRPCGVDPDCLRNAINCFAYQPPDQLPLISPAATLSSEPHNFSRVFTGAFFEAFAGMMVTLGRPSTPETLLQASQDAGRLIVAAVRAAPVVPDYFAQVAAQLLEADRTLFNGRYANALQFGLQVRGILSAASVTRGAAPTLAVAAVTPRTARRSDEELPVLLLSGRDFGLADRPLVVRAAAESGRLAVASTALDGTSATAPSGGEAARAFVSELVVRNRVQLPDEPEEDLADPFAPLRTHAVEEQDGALVLVRKLVDCVPVA